MFYSPKPGTSGEGAKSRFIESSDEEGMLFCVDMWLCYFKKLIKILLKKSDSVFIYNLDKVTIYMKTAKLKVLKNIFLSKNGYFNKHTHTHLSLIHI